MNETLETQADALLAAQPDPGSRHSDGGFVFTYGQAQRAVMAALSTRPPATGDAAREAYSLGLMTEEMGETLKIIGKALRFGLDAPGPASPEYRGLTAREMLPFEVGDLHAAIRFAAMAGVVKMSAANLAEEEKLAKLLNPDSRDANGNRLAPALDPPKVGEA